MPLQTVQNEYKNTTCPYSGKTKKEAAGFSSAMNKAGQKQEQECVSEGRGSESLQTCQEQLSAHIQTILKKLASGDTEEKFQIGAQSLSIDEWNEFLKGFDSVQEEIMETMRERHQKQELKQKKQEETDRLLTEKEMLCKPQEMVV